MRNDSSDSCQFDQWNLSPLTLDLYLVLYFFPFSFLFIFCEGRGRGRGEVRRVEMGRAKFKEIFWFE